VLLLYWNWTAMAFKSGSRDCRRSKDDEDTLKIDIDAGEEGVIELNDIEEEEQPCQAQAASKINPRLLGGEKGKNDGESKHWRCNHCKKAFKNSLTRWDWFASLVPSRRSGNVVPN
jgi:hypothetical protein